MKKVHSDDQLDVFAKDVPWSNVQMLRSVLETDKFSPKEFYNFIVALESTTSGKDDDISKMAERGLINDNMAEMVKNGENVYFVWDNSPTSNTRITFRQLSFPWP